MKKKILLAITLIFACASLVTCHICTDANLFCGLVMGVAGALLGREVENE